MLIRFYASAGKDREEGLASALRDGARAAGDTVEIVPSEWDGKVETTVDIACAFGVKGHTKEIIETYRAAGKRTLMFDKALIRPILGSPSGYNRISIDGGSPVLYLMRASRSFERWERLGVPLRSREDHGLRGSIIFAGSSQKYCTWWGLGDANEYARKFFAEAKRWQKKRPKIYRPKPSWTGYEEIEGTILSRPPQALIQLLPRAHVVVTHGSSAAIDAILNGVPAITLGPCAANPVTSRSVRDVMDPFWPSDQARWQWACQIAWCQWTEAEMRSGEMWEFFRNELAATEGKARNVDWNAAWWTPPDPAAGEADDRSPGRGDRETERVDS